jgi:hypothetical protein
MNDFNSNKKTIRENFDLKPVSSDEHTLVFKLYLKEDGSFQQ